MSEHYQLIYTKDALKDAKKLGNQPKLIAKVQQLLGILKVDPLSAPCKVLRGKLLGAYSRRINIKHRIVYQVLEETKKVKVLRMWTHYNE